MSEAPALQAAVQRQAQLHALVREVYGALSRRQYEAALDKLEQALARANAVPWYLAPDEGALDRLVAAASVTRELCRRVDHAELHHAGEVLTVAVDLRVRIAMGER